MDNKTPGQSNVTFDPNTNSPMIDISGMKYDENTPLEDIAHQYDEVGKQYGEMVKRTADNVGARQRSLIGNDFGATNPYMYNTYYEGGANTFRSGLMVNATQEALTEGMRRGKAEAEAALNKAKSDYNNAYNSNNSARDNYQAAQNRKIQAAEALTDQLPNGTTVGESNIIGNIKNAESADKAVSDNAWGNVDAKMGNNITFDDEAKWKDASNKTLEHFGHTREEMEGWSDEENRAFWDNPEVGNYWNDVYREDFYRNLGGDEMANAYITNRDNARTAITQAWQALQDLSDNFAFNETFQKVTVELKNALGEFNSGDKTADVNLDDWQTVSKDEWIDEYIPEGQRADVKKLRDDTLKTQEGMMASGIPFNPETYNSIWNNYIQRIKEMAQVANEDKSEYAEKVFANGITTDYITQERDAFMQENLGFSYSDLQNMIRMYREQPDLINAINEQVAQIVGQVDTIEVADGEKWYKIGNEYKQLDKGTVVLFGLPGAFDDKGNIVDKDFKDFVENYSKLYDDSIEDKEKVIEAINNARSRYLDKVGITLYGENYYDNAFSKEVMRAVMYMKDINDYGDLEIYDGKTANQIIEDFTNLINTNPEKARNSYAALIEKANTATGSVLIKDYNSKNIGSIKTEIKGGDADGQGGNDSFYGATKKSQEAGVAYDDLDVNKSIALLTVLDAAIDAGKISKDFFGATGQSGLGDTAAGIGHAILKDLDTLINVSAMVGSLGLQMFDFVSRIQGKPVEIPNPNTWSFTKMVERWFGNDVGGDEGWLGMGYNDSLELFYSEDLQHDDPYKYQSDLARLQRNNLGSVIDPLMLYSQAGATDVKDIVGLGDNVVSTGKLPWQNLYAAGDMGRSLLVFGGSLAIESILPSVWDTVASLASKGASSIKTAIASRIFTNADEVLNLAKTLANGGEVTSKAMKQARLALYEMGKEAKAMNKAINKMDDLVLGRVLMSSDNYANELMRIASQNTNVALHYTASFDDIMKTVEQSANANGTVATIGDFSNAVTSTKLNNAATGTMVSLDNYAWAQQGYIEAAYKGAMNTAATELSDLSAFLYKNVDNAVSTFTRYTDAVWAATSQADNVYGKVIRALESAGGETMKALEAAVKESAAKIATEAVATSAISMFTGISDDLVAQLPSSVKKLLTNAINKRGAGASMYLSQLSQEAITDITKQFIDAAMSKAAIKGAKPWTNLDTLRILSANGWGPAARIALTQTFLQDVGSDMARDLIRNMTMPTLTNEGVDRETPAEYFTNPYNWVFNVGLAGVGYIGRNLKNQAMSSIAMRKIEKYSNAIASSGSKEITEEMSKTIKKLNYWNSKAQKYAQEAFKKGVNLDTVQKNLDAVEKATKKAQDYIWENQGMDSMRGVFANKNMTKDEFFKLMNEKRLTPSENLYHAYTLVSTNATSNFINIRNGLTAGTKYNLTGVGTLQSKQANLELHQIFEDVRREMGDSVTGDAVARNTALYNEMKERAVGYLSGLGIAGSKAELEAQMGYYFDNLIHNMKESILTGGEKNWRLGYTPIGSFYSETDFADPVMRGLSFGGDTIDWTTASPFEQRNVKVQDLLDAFKRGDKEFAITDEMGNVTKKYKLDERGLNLQDNLVVYNNALNVHKYVDPTFGINGNDYGMTSLKNGYSYIVNLDAGKKTAKKDIARARKSMEEVRNNIYERRFAANEELRAEYKAQENAINSEIMKGSPELDQLAELRRNVADAKKSATKAERVFRAQDLPEGYEMLPAKLFNLQDKAGNYDIAAGKAKWTAAYNSVMNDVALLNNGKLNPNEVGGMITIDVEVNGIKAKQDIPVDTEYIAGLVDAAANNQTITHDMVAKRMIQMEANVPYTMVKNKSGEMVRQDVKKWKSALNNKNALAQNSIAKEVLDEFGSNAVMQTTVKFGDKEIDAKLLANKIQVNNTGSAGVNTVEQILDGVIGGSGMRLKSGELTESGNRLKQAIMAQVRAETMNTGGFLDFQDVIDIMDKYLPDKDAFSEALSSGLVTKLNSLRNSGGSLYVADEMRLLRDKLAKVADDSDLAQLRDVVDNAYYGLQKIDEYRYSPQTMTTFSEATNDEGFNAFDNTSTGAEVDFENANTLQEQMNALASRGESAFAGGNAEPVSKADAIKIISDINTTLDILTNPENKYFKEYGSQLIVNTQVAHANALTARTEAWNDLAADIESFYKSGKNPEWNKQVDELALRRAKNSAIAQGKDPSRVKNAKPTKNDFLMAMGVVPEDQIVTPHGTNKTTPQQYYAVKADADNYMMSKGNSNSVVDLTKEKYTPYDQSYVHTVERKGQKYDVHVENNGEGIVIKMVDKDGKVAKETLKKGVKTYEYKVSEPKTETFISDKGGNTKPKGDGWKFSKWTENNEKLYTRNTTQTVTKKITPRETGYNLAGVTDTKPSAAGIYAQRRIDAGTIGGSYNQMLDALDVLDQFGHKNSKLRKRIEANIEKLDALDRTVEQARDLLYERHEFAGKPVKDVEGAVQAINSFRTDPTTDNLEMSLAAFLADVYDEEKVLQYRTLGIEDELKNGGKASMFDIDGEQMEFISAGQSRFDPNVDGTKWQENYQYDTGVKSGNDNIVVVVSNELVDANDRREIYFARANDPDLQEIDINKIGLSNDDIDKLTDKYIEIKSQDDKTASKNLMDHKRDTDAELDNAFATRDTGVAAGSKLQNKIEMQKKQYDTTYPEFLQKRAGQLQQQYASGRPNNNGAADLVTATSELSDAEDALQRYIELSSQMTRDMDKARLDFEEKSKLYESRSKALEKFKKQNVYDIDERIVNKYGTAWEKQQWEDAKADRARAQDFLNNKDADFYISKDGAVFMGKDQIGKGYARLSDVLGLIGYDEDLINRVSGRFKIVDGEEVYEYTPDDLKSIAKESHDNRKMTRKLGKQANSGDYRYKKTTGIDLLDNKKTYLNEISKYKSGKNIDSVRGSINKHMGLNLSGEDIVISKDYANMLMRLSGNTDKITKAGKVWGEVMQATIDLNKWIQNFQMAGGASWVNSLTLTQLRGAIYSDPKAMARYLSIVGDIKNANATYAAVQKHYGLMQEIAMISGDTSVLSDLNGAIGARPGLEDMGTVNSFITRSTEGLKTMFDNDESGLIKKYGKGMKDYLNNDLGALFEDATFKQALPVLRMEMLAENYDQAMRELQKRFSNAADVSIADDLHQAALAMSYAKTTAFFEPGKSRSMDIGTFLEKVKTDKINDFVMAQTGAKAGKSLLDVACDWCFALRYKMGMAGRVYTGMAHTPGYIKQGIELGMAGKGSFNGGDFGTDKLLNMIGTRYMRQANVKGVRSMAAVALTAAIGRSMLGIPTAWDDISFIDEYDGSIKIPEVLLKTQTIGQIWLPNDTDENGMPIVDPNKTAYNLDMFSSIFTLPNSVARTVDKIINPETQYAAPQRGLGNKMGGTVNNILNSRLGRALGDELIGSNLLSPYKAMYEVIMDTSYFGNNIWEKKYLSDGSVNPNYDEARNWAASIYHILGLDDYLTDGTNREVKGNPDYTQMIDQIGTVSGSGIIQHEYTNAIINWAKGNAIEAIIEAGELPIKKSTISSTARTEFNTRVKNLMIQAFNNYENDIATMSSPEEKEVRFNDFAKECADMMATWSKKYGYVLGANQELVAASTRTMMAIVAGQTDTRMNYVQGAYWKASQTAQIQQGEKLFLQDSDWEEWRDKGYTYEEFAAERNRRSEAYNQALSDEYDARQALKAANVDAKMFGDYNDRDIDVESWRVNKKVSAQVEAALSKPVGEFKNFKEMKEYYEEMIANATSTKSKAKLANTYNEYVTDAIAPYINEYGANLLNSGFYNGEYLSNKIADYIIMPADQYYGGKSPRANYLKDLFDVGYRNKKALKSDEEVYAEFARVIRLTNSGATASAANRLDSLLKMLKTGELYASPSDYSDIIRLRAQLSARSKN